MSAEDFKINATVRRVFSQLWIDVTHVSHRTVRGSVHISGRIIHVGGSEPDGDIHLMERLHSGIRAIPGVHEVAYNFDNWMYDGMSWKLVGAAKNRAEREAEKMRELKEMLRKAAAGETDEKPPENPEAPKEGGAAEPKH